MQTNTSPRSTIELISAIWNRRKWIFILGFLAVFSAAMTVIWNLPQLYKSTATVLVGQDSVSDSFVKSSVSNDLGARLQVIKYEILSRSRLEELIHRFNLYPEIRQKAPFEAVLGRMRKDIKFEIINTSQQWGPGSTVAFSLSYQGFDPELVAQVTNTLASSYLDENKRIRINQATATTMFLENGLKDAKAALDNQQRKTVRSPVATVAPTTVSATGLEERVNLTRELTRLKQELTVLQSRFTDKYPDVIRVKKEIGRLEKDISNRPAIPVRNNATIAYRDDASRMDVSLEDAVGERYLSLLSRYEEAQLAEILEQQSEGQFRILDAAVPSKISVEPKFLRLVLMGLILSLGFGAAVVMFVEQFDNSIHTANDLKDFTRVPILVAIPRIETANDRVKHWLSLSFITVFTTAGLALIMQVSYVTALENYQLVWFLAQRGT